MTLRPRVAVVIVALVFPVVSWAAPRTAADWFSFMQKALASRSYTGTVVYVHEGRPLAYHLVVAKDGFALLTALSGPAREIIRGPRLVVRVRPGGGTMVIHGGAMPLPFPPATQVDLRQLADYYRIKFSGWDRVAGEPARILAVIPKDDWRYGYRVWIGEHSGLPLRSELISNNGAILQQAFFTQLQLQTASQAHAAIGPKALSLLKQAEVSASHEMQGPCSGEAMEEIDASELPPGFHDLKTVCEEPPAVVRPVTHFLVGDGLTTISVFVVRRHRYGNALVGSTTLGAVHAVGVVQNGFSVTVMGDAPFLTITRVAHSVAVSGN